MGIGTVIGSLVASGWTLPQVEAMTLRQAEMYLRVADERASSIARVTAYELAKVLGMIG